MKIGFSGTHSTGKTTLVKSLHEKMPEFYLDINVSRWVHGLGFPLNQSTSDASQELNLIKRVAHLSSYNNLIADRTIVDNIAYSIAGWERGTVSDSSITYQMELYYKNIEKYDVIFYIPPEIDLDLDGVRPEDNDYRNEIDQLIVKLLYGDQIYFPNMVIRIEGTVAERESTVLEYIKILSE